MTAKRVHIERSVVISSEPFERVAARLETGVGHHDMPAVARSIAASKIYAERERVVNAATGQSGFMETARFEMGEVLRKETGADAPKIVRFVIGNPLIMKQMVVHVPDAAPYAPVTVVVDQRPDGVHLSYDTMASALAPYGSPEALKVARDLDAKVAALLAAAADRSTLTSQACR
jgi:uncharacterized protein (DUF302 family)